MHHSTATTDFGQIPLGVIASLLVHLSAVMAMLFLSSTPPRVAGSQMVTISLIDAIEASAAKPHQPRAVLEQPKPALLPRQDQLKPQTQEETLQEKDEVNSVASTAAAAQGDPVDDPIREAIYTADYLHNPKPVYPSLSRRLGEEGLVLLRVHVSTEGLPLDVVVKASSGFSRLDQAAVAVVKNWQFVPAKRGPFTLVSWVDVPLQFSLSK